MSQNACVCHRGDSCHLPWCLSELSRVSWTLLFSLFVGEVGMPLNSACVRYPQRSHGHQEGAHLHLTPGYSCRGVPWRGWLSLSQNAWFRNGSPKVERLTPAMSCAAWVFLTVFLFPAFLLEDSRLCWRPHCGASTWDQCQTPA